MSKVRKFEPADLRLKAGSYIAVISDATLTPDPEAPVEADADVMVELELEFFGSKGDSFKQYVDICFDSYDSDIRKLGNKHYDRLLESLGIDRRPWDEPASYLLEIPFIIEIDFKGGIADFRPIH